MGAGVVKGQDQSEPLADAVRRARSDGGSLRIVGAGTKSFLTGPAASPDFGGDGRWLSTADHAGVVDYRPEELVITARAGTPLIDLERLLAERGQMLPFEPPRLRGGGTLGGAIAVGLAGPSRPWLGAVRDSVLGVELVNGEGQQLRFGGQVMKNVAGYDVSRLQAGAFGTLGLLLAASVKLLPHPAAECTLVFEMDAAMALDRIRTWVRQPWPVTATAMLAGRLFVRLSGAEAAVANAAARLGGERRDGAAWWASLRDHQHDFFTGRDGQVLWRTVVPPASPIDDAEGLIMWGGAQRWRWHEPGDGSPANAAAACGGHARPFDAGFGRRDGAHLAAAERRLSARLRAAFDPAGVFNRHLSRGPETNAH